METLIKLYLENIDPRFGLLHEPTFKTYDKSFDVRWIVLLTFLFVLKLILCSVSMSISPPWKVDTLQIIHFLQMQE